MKRNGKALLIIALMVLSGGVKGSAIEREGVIVLPPEFVPDWETYYNYYLDTNGDGFADTEMSVGQRLGRQVMNLLPKYLQQGVTVVFEDEGLKPNEDFGAGRMIGFILPDGQFVRLDQMFSQEVIKQNFPRLWKKIQAEQRASR